LALEVTLLAHPAPAPAQDPALAMTRPGDGDNSSARATENARALAVARPTAGRLKKRADFLAAAKGRRQHQRCFVLQAALRPSPPKPLPSNQAASLAEPQPDATAEAGAPRFGFTVTKKVGNSVVRNRIRRRLREAVRLTDLSPRPDHDYVLVARIEALTAPFEQLRGELAQALSRIHQTGARPPKTYRQTGSDRQSPAVKAADTKQDL
jgi:ribonuclease P protein component